MATKENAVNEVQKTASMDKVSGSKDTDIINHWLTELDVKSDERTLMSNWRKNNTVAWVVGKRQNKLMKVQRLHEKFVGLCNSHNAEKNNYVMDAVYTVSVAQTGKATRRVLTVGFNRAEKRFYVLGNGSMVCKLSTTGSNPNDVIRAGAVLATAMRHAATNVVDDTRFSYLESLPTTDVDALTFTPTDALASMF